MQAERYLVACARMEGRRKTAVLDKRTLIELESYDFPLNLEELHVLLARQVCSHTALRSEAFAIDLWRPDSGISSDELAAREMKRPGLPFAAEASRA